GNSLSRVAEVKTRISSVELLATLKKSYSYRELSAVLGLSAPILSRYVRGHVLPSAARSEKFIATFREKLLRKMIMDEVRVSQDGSYNISSVVSNVGLLRQIAKVVFSEFGLVGVDRVVTMEVDGVPLAAEVAGEFNVNLAVVRAERDLGVEEFIEQKAVYSPSTVKYLYLSKTAIKKGEHVLIVDDLVRSGTTIEALARIAERAKARIVGVFAIASVDQSMPKLRSRLGLTCPIESLVTLEQKQRRFSY
ncbi:MAG TPA: phosphoribosyltransferase family protein, partial [Nitrososphaerales archaeon]|nr:phosphoribosyltransferase family protein [Nitrososphaerales archaeon]